MDKAVEMGKTSATGGLQLFFGRIASTLVMAIGSIVVGIYIAQSDYGLYTIALVPSATLLLFMDWGVGSAMIKYCANYKAKKMEEELRNTIVAGFMFLVASGLALTLLSLLLASYVASTIFNSPQSTLLIALASVTVFSTAINLGSDSVFVGFERMKLKTITLIFAATAQGLLSPLLVYLGFGAFGAMVGYTIGSIASGVTSVSLLYFGIIRKLPPISLNMSKVFETVKLLLNYGIPLSVGNIMGGLSPQIYYFLMASFTDKVLIGNYRIAGNFAVILTFFMFPIQTVLFPAFSKINPSKDKPLLKTVFSSSAKYASLFLVPVVIALMVLSGPLINTIYGDKWPFAHFYLTLYVVGDLFVLLGNPMYGLLLNATGETRLIMKLSALKLCIGVPVAFLLIPSFGILGLIIGSLISGVPTTLAGLFLTWKRYETKVDLGNSAKILLASTIAGIVTYLFQTVVVAPAFMILALGVTLFLATYLISAPLIGAANQTDIINLKAMFSGLGPTSKLLGMLLKPAEKTLGIRKKMLEHTTKNKQTLDSSINGQYPESELPSEPPEDQDG